MKIGAQGYVIGRGGKLEHVAIVEAAMGHPMPRKSCVHHFNENRADNRHSNLVVCQDAAYHQLLHVRQRALAETGNANLRQCDLCGEYDDPENFLAYRNRHAACVKAYDHEWRSRRRAARTICRRGHALTALSTDERGRCRACMSLGRLGKKFGAHQNPRALHSTCKNGHPRTPDNLSSRGCKTCRLEQQRVRRATRRTA